MDIRRYLQEQIDKCRRRMNLAKLIDCGVLFAAAGGIAGICCELVSLVWPFYYAHLAAGLCFVAGFLAGTVRAFCKRADRRQAARRLDSFGLKERMITACEQMDRDDEFAQMQRQDACLHYNQARGRIKIPLLPDKRHLLALLLSAAAVLGMSLIPSPVREQAQVRHQVQAQAEEERETLEELLDALEGVDMESLTEEQRQRLQELAETMKLSQEELAGADSWESLASATERLDYKYEQAAQGLQELAARMTDPGSAGIATAQALAKAAANRDGQQMASSGTPRGNSGENGGGSGDGNGNGNDGGGSGDGNGSGNDGGGSGEGNGSGNDGGGSGNGNGNGGNGDGSGSGGGNGDGNGMGNGRGTGSSDAVHDYVSIPNAVAEDPSLTGNKNGDRDSDYYRQQNGLAWEGNHVEYGSVIGEYTENAYEGIANGRYPSGMETVIRDYFESLNQ